MKWLLIAVLVVAGVSGCNREKSRAESERFFTLKCADINPGTCKQCARVQKSAEAIEYPWRSFFGRLFDFVEMNASALGGFLGLEGATILALVGIGRGMIRRRNLALDLALEQSDTFRPPTLDTTGLATRQLTAGVLDLITAAKTRNKVKAIIANVKPNVAG